MSDTPQKPSGDSEINADGTTPGAAASADPVADRGPAVDRDLADDRGDDLAEPPAEPLSASSHVNAAHRTDGIVPEPSPGAAAAAEPGAVSSMPPDPALGVLASAESVAPAQTTLDDAESAASSSEPAEPEPAAAPADPGSAEAAAPADAGTAAAAQPETAGIAQPETAGIAQPETAGIAPAETGSAAPVPEPDQAHPTTAQVMAANAAAASLEPAPAEGASAAPATPYGHIVSPIFVSSPTPPKKKSNRGYGSLIALVGTVGFALVYAGAVAGLGVVQYSTVDFWTDFTSYLENAAFYVPVIFFAVAMILLVQLINRAGWWAYLIGGMFVGAVVYLAFIGGALAQHASGLTPDALSRFLGTLWLNAFGIAAAISAREVSIWTGLWLAARGRRLKAANAQARADYERSLVSLPRPATPVGSADVVPGPPAAAAPAGTTRDPAATGTAGPDRPGDAPGVR